MDRIIVFDQGAIVEMGTHNELMEKGGLYASMAKAQSVA
jgi:ABC-type multidrug transport system fused ATPase/permease subunit